MILIGSLLACNASHSAVSCCSMAALTNTQPLLCSGFVPLWMFIVRHIMPFRQLARNRIPLTVSCVRHLRCRIAKLIFRENRLQFFPAHLPWIAPVTPEHPQHSRPLDILFRRDVLQIVRPPVEHISVEVIYFVALWS